MAKKKSNFVLPIDSDNNYIIERMEAFIHEVPISRIAKIWIPQLSKYSILNFNRLVDEKGNLEDTSDLSSLVGKRIIITKYYQEKKIVGWNARFAPRSQFIEKSVEENESEPEK